MKSYPNIATTVNSLMVEFAPNPSHAKDLSLKMVLDYGESGEVIGVEILNLAFEAGNNCLGIIQSAVPIQGDDLKFSYDEECDAFYLRLRSGRSLQQKVVQGNACLDNDSRIVSLNAEWHSL
ncbi:MAG TPA: DUF2283 domain-containing protein [Fimbriiglobus sp.]